MSVEGGVIVIPPGLGVAVGDALIRIADEQVHAGTTYRVLDLVARKTVKTGLSFNEAHSFIQREKRRRPQARFDIRTEVRQ